MLTKEYRILLPLTVDEYRIAQLYMIQKKSRVDTSGAGSGVEIIKNEPYVKGPGGAGQYTYKIFHIGSHLPAWFRAILPATALQVEEEAWNAYPYTRTRYTCPFIPRFSLDVETRYYNDAGTQSNVFGLRKSEMNQRIVDVMDIVNDQISFMDYLAEEDPKLYVSSKTGRGPLGPDWVSDCTKKGTPVMCAYKLCKVEFKYWGMQTRIEKFIQDVALRKTMLRAHRQAWAWQDEWHGLTIADIRALEVEAQDHLAKVMAEALRSEEGEEGPAESSADGAVSGPPTVSIGYAPSDSGSTTDNTITNSHQKSRLLAGGRNSPSVDAGSIRSRTSSMTARAEMLELIKSDSEEEAEFFDAQEELEEEQEERAAHVRWPSDLLDGDEDDLIHSALTPPGGECRTKLLLLVFHAGSVLDASASTAGSATTSQEHLPTSNYSATGSTKSGDLQTFRSTLESVVDSHYPQLSERVAVRCVACPAFAAEALALLSSLGPYGSSPSFVQPALVPILATRSASYDDAVTQAVVRANQVYADFLMSEEGAGFAGEVYVIGDALGGILAYDAAIRTGKMALSRNPSQLSGVTDTTDVSAVIPEDEEEDPFVSQTLPSPPNGHNLPVTRLNIRAATISGGDEDEPSVRRPRTASGSQPHSPGPASAPVFQLQLTIPAHPPAARHTSLPNYGRRSPGPPSPRPRTHSDESAASDDAAASPGRLGTRLRFKTTNMFLFGTPLGLVLSQRRLVKGGMETPPKPAAANVHNLYYAQDPCCARLEPLLCPAFAGIEPVNVPRFARYPLGTTQPLHLLECLHRHVETLLRPSAVPARLSAPESQTDQLRRKLSTLSTSSELDGGALGQSLSSFQSILSHWWGLKRMDFALYCPEGLANFPQISLPNLLHASFWESPDVAAFLLRQFLAAHEPRPWDSAQSGATNSWVPPHPTEKWSRKRTSFKIKNTSANHRGNDVVVGESEEQKLSARFMYGPLDVVALTGETVDVYTRTEEGSGEWTQLGSDRTDSHGRVCFVVPEEKRLPLGLHPIKMVVRGDHTYLDMFMAVVPPLTECVVFSIDGSFTASMSVSGKDPKVRAAAVDVVRHWQDLGFLILYVTARPDMQQRQVISWLAQHNFPHGLLFFSDKITTDPLKQKTNYLGRLVSECGISIAAAYGSGKDVQVYSAAQLSPERIFIVGKASKKHQNGGVVLADGYSAHLAQLSSGGVHISRPAQGNGRLLLRKSNFALPTHGKIAPVQRSASFTPRMGQYEDGSSPASTPSANTSQKRRGLSPFRFSVRRSKD